ncbi:hypothetical protein SAMN05443575_2691 [Jatrophihabitans endophyticus]|uniref:Uncharacterized protein n=1 Tax=Jatrophihabitans endophyticus TaxID=1206085 RepID=A0A1M5MCG5_9ACTN|nr:hypothetical protein [Jatrophihabitans endophyticus]SHG74968.1 hypothetical protein SAMN05443575_2691 [Jatrophihabitans endophyticus]
MHPDTAPRQPHSLPSRPEPQRPVLGVRDVPVPVWVALALGAVGFVLRVSFQEIVVGTGVGYSCTYTDIAGFGFAVALVGCTVAAWRSWSARAAAWRIPVPFMAVFTVVALALAVVHALRGNGTIMSPCDSHPMP